MRHTDDDERPDGAERSEASVTRHAELLDRTIPGWRASLPQVCEYLRLRRKQKALGDDTFGVVFAITQYCNLSCRHCAVAARHLNRAIEPSDGNLSYEQIVTIMEKVHQYGTQTATPVFFMFGGGEPTLRDDFSEIVRDAAGLFGVDGTGFCTNGTFRSPRAVLETAGKVGLLEVSLDGDEEYHNRWRMMEGGAKAAFNAYDRTIGLIREAVATVPDKLEVTSVVTRENLESLSNVIRFLRDLGVRNYSIHRPLPVGRMAPHRGLIPGISDYYRLLVMISAIVAEDQRMHLHLHHSIESIYSALFLGDDIHRSALPMGSRRHSIGISWDGSVHFDPWSLVPPFSKFSPGNLLDDACDLEGLWGNHSILQLMAQAKRANVRCHCCPERCTGGMRLSAMADFIVSRGAELTTGDFVTAVSQVDPACPLCHE